MLFTAITELSTRGINTDEVEMTLAGWQENPNPALSYTPLCNLVNGCGAYAQHFIEHPATGSRWGVCTAFHTVEVVADSLQHKIANAIEVAAYLAEDAALSG
ncbi:hypothetical protein [Streptomyces erythrochromogenes]|uniref:hypothetical protein n=1 Tax=Streptomyces erythrochromogenes TaxID=285574 RepID=UPI00369D30B4